jgi:DNA-binding response OmpR family regulator
VASAFVAASLLREIIMAAPSSRHTEPAVLLVEDDETTRNIMMRILVGEGYLVLTADRAHDALQILRTPLAPIDVVLLDVELPDVSGIVLCALIREMHPNLPVIVYTGQAQPAEVARLLELGVQRYFLKPVAAAELLATVKAALPRTKSFPFGQ